jgi:preprotein translocase subunit SecG
MSFWVNIVVIVHVLVALSIIGLVLLQHGKGADMGSGFGGGASSSLFGATGSANFLSRATGVLATVFFILSLALAYIASNTPRDSGSVVDRVRSSPKPAASEKAGEKPVEKKDAAPADSASQKPAPAAGEAPKDKNVPQ